MILSEAFAFTTILHNSSTSNIIRIPRLLILKLRSGVSSFCPSVIVLPTGSSVNALVTLQESLKVSIFCKIQIALIFIRISLLILKLLYKGFLFAMKLLLFSFFSICSFEILPEEFEFSSALFIKKLLANFCSCLKTCLGFFSLAVAGYFFYYCSARSIYTFKYSVNIQISLAFLEERLFLSEIYFGII